MSNFPCSQCGLCCQNVNLSPQTQFLDRGDGTCKNHDQETKKCLIYDHRPQICRVEDYYNQVFYKEISWNEYVKKNTDVCKTLQEEFELVRFIKTSNYDA